MGRAHPRPSPRLHRLVDLRGQSRPHRRQHRPKPHQSGGAIREGSALAQGIATCGHCGRRLRTHYRGTRASPGYHCAGKDIVNGRAVYCLNIGGVQIDQAITQAILTAVTPAGIAAAVQAEQRSTPRTMLRSASGVASRAPSLRSTTGRTPLSRRRPGEPARRPQPRGEGGAGADAPSRGRSRPCSPRAVEATATACRSGRARGPRHRSPSGLAQLRQPPLVTARPC